MKLLLTKKLGKDKAIYQLPCSKPQKMELCTLSTAFKKNIGTSLLREMQLEGIQNLDTRGELGHDDGLKRYRGSVEVSKGKRKEEKKR